jgi:hypothetical protein
MTRFVDLFIMCDGSPYSYSQSRSDEISVVSIQPLLMSPVGTTYNFPSLSEKSLKEESH